MRTRLFPPPMPAAPINAMEFARVPDFTVAATSARDLATLAQGSRSDMGGTHIVTPDPFGGQ